MYEGLADGIPAVAVDVSDSPRGALRAFERADLSTVNAVDTAIGKVALVVLLDGGREGNYGIGMDEVVPPIDPHIPSEPDQGE